MNSYQNMIMELLPGDTPKAKFDYLSNLLADTYMVNQLLKVSFSEKDMIDFANGMKHSSSAEVVQHDLDLYKKGWSI